MAYLKSNIVTLIFAVVLLGLIGMAIYADIKRKNADNVKRWLRWAVVQAEKDFGSNTGQLKLMFVYNLMICRFPLIGKMIPFSTFSSWVDEALRWMNEQLDINDSIKKVVCKEETNE